MSTAAQIIANRENARASTGPKTDEGKAICSQNAARHQLTARGFIVLPGHQDLFAQLEAGLRLNLFPAGDLEETLFKRILECAWNLQRCSWAEARLYESSVAPTIDPLLDDQNEAKYARIQKYARQNENSMVKCMRELGRLQTEVQYRRAVDPITEEDPQALSAVCNYRKAVEGANRQNRPQKSVVQNRANLHSQDFTAILGHVTAPPIRRNSDIKEDEPAVTQAA